MDKELKACRNCGGKCDPTGWMRGDGRQGPECEGCGITTPDVESWNRLMGGQDTSQEGDAVGEVRALSDGKQYAALYTMAGQHLVGEKLYTHPADQVECSGDPVGSFAKHMEYMQRCIELEADQAKLRELLTAWRRMFDGGIASGELGVLRVQTEAALAKP